LMFDGQPHLANTGGDQTALAAQSELAKFHGSRVPFVVISRFAPRG
jgi:hypothetical protein